MGGPGFGDGMSDEGENESDYGLDEVSSDVEMNGADIMINGMDDDSEADEAHGRIEEVVATEVVAASSSKKDKKRQRESDAVADTANAVRLQNFTCLGRS